MRNPDLQVTTLDLAEFEYLLDKAHQTRRVDRDYVVERLPVCGGAAQAVKRGNDDRQGRHQLVGDIGKELQFGVVQLLGFPAFEFRNADFMLHAQPVAQEADRTVGHPRKGCEIERHGPPRAPGCRQDTHLQHPLVAAPDTVAARRLQMKGINARRQVVVGGEAVLRIDQYVLLVEPVQLVFEDVVPRIGIRKHRKFDIEIVLPVGQRHLICIVDLPGADMLPLLFRHGTQGLVVNPEIGQYDRKFRLVGLDAVARKDAQSVRTAERHASVFDTRRCIAVEEERLQVCRNNIGVDMLGSTVFVGREREHGIVGRNPHAAVLIPCNVGDPLFLDVGECRDRLETILRRRIYRQSVGNRPRPEVTRIVRTEAIDVIGRHPRPTPVLVPVASFRIDTDDPVAVGRNPHDPVAGAADIEYACRCEGRLPPQPYVERRELPGRRFDINSRPRTDPQIPVRILP